MPIAKRSLITLVVACIPALSGIAQNKDTAQIVRKDLLTAALADTKEVSRVEIKQIDLQPGQKAGAHRHPIPVVGYVVSGAIQFQVERGAVRTLHAGEAFFEPANVPILHFDNQSAAEPARFIAYYLLGKDDQKLIEMLQ